MTPTTENLRSSVVRTVGDTYREWVEHRTIRLGAGLAYYGTFALVPILAVSVAIASIFFARDEVQEYLTTQLTDVFGDNASMVGAAIAETLDNATSTVGLGLLGVVTLLVTSSVLVVALQDALNTIWERPPRTGIRRTVMRRIVAFVVVAGVGAVLVITFALNAISALFGELVPDVVVVESLGEVLGAAVSWALGVGVLVLLFRYLPEDRVQWRSALPGAAVTAVLVAVGTVAIVAYLRRYSASSVVGATGSVFLVLLWIYYEAQIILAGAEFTRVLALRASVGDDGQARCGPGEDAAVDVGR